MRVRAAAANDDGGQRLRGHCGGSPGVFASLVSLQVERLTECERAIPAVQLARLMNGSQVAVEAALLRESFFAPRAIQSFHRRVLLRGGRR